jgi:hypothetical protein
MKRLALLLVGALACATGPFEGEIHKRRPYLPGERITDDVTFVRGAMSRSAMPGVPGYSLLSDQRTGRILLIDEKSGKREVYRAGWDDLFGYVVGGFRKVTVTDREDTVAGMRCRLVLFEVVETGLEERCLTSELGDLGYGATLEFFGRPPLGGTADGKEATGLADLRAAFGGRIFPLRVVSVDADDRHVNEEVVEVVPRRFDPKWFE